MYINIIRLRPTYFRRHTALRDRLWLVSLPRAARHVCGDQEGVHIHTTSPAPSSRHLRALLSFCGGCSFAGLGCCSCRMCVCRCGGVVLCVCVCMWHVDLFTSPPLSSLPPTLTSARPPTRVWEVVRTVAAPPPIVVQCGGGGSSCGRLWCCSCRDVCCVVLFLLCVCVCDLVLFSHHQPIVHSPPSPIRQPGPCVSVYTILPSPILYGVYHKKEGRWGGRILRNGDAIVL